jgi:hypothetical protein
VVAAPLLREAGALVRLGDHVEQLAVPRSRPRGRDDGGVDLGRGADKVHQPFGRWAEGDDPRHRHVQAVALDGEREQGVPAERSRSGQRMAVHRLPLLARDQVHARDEVAVAGGARELAGRL